MTTGAKEGGTLADFMAFLWRHRVLIVGLTGILTLATIIYVLVIPVEYTAKATLLPHESSRSGLFSAALAYMDVTLTRVDPADCENYTGQSGMGPGGANYDPCHAVETQGVPGVAAGGESMAAQ